MGWGSILPKTYLLSPGRGGIRAIVLNPPNISSLEIMRFLVHLGTSLMCQVFESGMFALVFAYYVVICLIQEILCVCVGSILALAGPFYFPKTGSSVFDIVILGSSRYPLMVWLTTSSTFGAFCFWVYGFWVRCCLSLTLCLRTEVERCSFLLKAN